METTGPIPGAATVASASAAAAAVRWQVGQLLQATVVESNIGKVLLAIGNRQVSSETSLLLDKGQQLTVQVRSLGDLPVLRIASGLNISPLTQAIRTLIPQQDTMTPLLASLARLTQVANPPVPPLIRDLTRLMVSNLPDTAAVSRPATLRTAIERSGLFLEHRLAQQLTPNTTPASNPAPATAIQADFKANLLQLIYQIRNWPGSTPATGAGQVTGAEKSLPPTPATGTNLPPVAPGSGEPSRAPAPPGTDALTANTGKLSTNPAQSATQAPLQTPVQGASPNAGQLARAVQSGVPTPLADARPATAAPPATTASPASGAPVSTATTATSTVLPATPPPFPGATPAPQAAVQATIDLVNRIGSLNTELLRQAEAALARVQLHQLASHPRDAERGILEWLLELPVRRGEEIDLWSMRIAREKQDDAAPQQEHQRDWTAQLAFDLPGLGPVQAQVSLRGERVSTRFWTGDETTLPLFREHLAELQNMFGHVGLEVGELDCVPGPMPAGAAAPSLIREKT